MGGRLSRWDPLQHLGPAGLKQELPSLPSWSLGAGWLRCEDSLKVATPWFRVQKWDQLLLGSENFIETLTLM